MAELDQTTVSRAVLIEVANVLGAYRDRLVLVGGWVPELLYPNRGHIRSLDVDFAVAPTDIADNAYETIRARLLEAGYNHHSGPASFSKSVDGAAKPVKVDFICGQYAEGEKSAAVRINELHIRSLRGIDLAFEACEAIEISGTMPDGTQNVVRSQIVLPEAFILIKAFALDERTKGKDAYDIAFVLHHYHPNLATLAERIRPHVAKGLGREALGILQAKFSSIDAVGPVRAAEAVPGTEHDFEQLQRAAFEDAQELFRQVDA